MDPRATATSEVIDESNFRQLYVEEIGSHFKSPDQWGALGFEFLTGSESRNKDHICASICFKQALVLSKFDYLSSAHLGWLHSLGYGVERNVYRAAEFLVVAVTIATMLQKKVPISESLSGFIRATRISNTNSKQGLDECVSERRYE